MNSTFTNQLVHLGDLNAVQRALLERRDEILTAIAEKRVAPSEGLMRELGELNIACGDVPEVGND